MTIERIQIDEKYTYQFDNLKGHVQILRNGEPWLGEEPGGFVGSKAWISAANELERLRKRVDELEAKLDTQLNAPPHELAARILAG